MNYNSWEFWWLFACVFVVYWRLNHRGQNALLLVASYIFYGFWDYRFLFLILISTVIDFIGGLGVAGVRLAPKRLARLGLLIRQLPSPMHTHQLSPARPGYHHGRWNGAVRKSAHGAAGLHYRPGRDGGDTGLSPGIALPLCSAGGEKTARVFLTISMVANLALLGFFKYCDFFIVNAKQLFDWLGWPVSWTTLGIILPAGISFYTFQAMSYTIDIYRGETEPTEHFGDFALFVCFFPHLVAGPHRPPPYSFAAGRPAQTAHARRHGRRHVPGADRTFQKTRGGRQPGADRQRRFFTLQEWRRRRYSSLDVLVGVYAFSFQIYGDFSGYSSIARGISKWLGYELIVNFNNPYIAVSPSDF